mmetsp:Transcript_4581/g.11560  ORF Transcript_4581/g.11560 Transcript_4581/m.11560 type:complete len:412 (+) Transcript_4581:238-1473(+)
MQVCQVLCETLELEHGGRKVLLGLQLVLRGLGLRLGLHRHQLLQVGDLGVGAGDGLLVCLLGLALRGLGFCHQLLRLRDELLEHLHHPSGTRARLVFHLSHWRHRPRRRVLCALAALEERLVLVVLCHPLRGLLQNINDDSLVGDHLLVVQILLSACEACALQRDLRFLDVVRGLGDVGLQRLDGGRQLRDLGLEVGLAVIRLQRGHLVLLELGLAPVVLLHLVLRLPLQHHDHVVDRLLDLRKGVQLDGVRQHRQLRAVRLRGHLAQRPGRLAAAVLHLGALRGGPAGRAPLQQAVRARGRVLGLVLGQDPDRLRHGNNLRLARRLALLPVLVRVRARHLHVLQEGLVVCQDGLLLAQVFLGLGQLVRGLGQLVLLLLLHLLSGLDLCRLRLAQHVELFGARGLVLLGLR